MAEYYILEGHKPVPVEDVITWAKWFETANRRVALTQVSDVEVSTVFLGADYNFGHVGPLLLFETMVFGGPLDQECARHSTWDQARAGHLAMVECVKEVMQ